MFTLKKFVAFALLLLVAMPIFLFSVFSIKQKIIQFQMHEKLEEAALEEIIIHNNDFSWVSNDEITVHGKLFDVKSHSKNVEATIFVGLYDNKEDAINKQLDANFYQKKLSDTNSGLSFLKLSQSPSLIQYLDNSISTHSNIIILHYKTFSEEARFLHLKVPNLPPIV